MLIKNCKVEGCDSGIMFDEIGGDTSMESASCSVTRRDYIVGQALNGLLIAMLPMKPDRTPQEWYDIEMGCLKHAEMIAGQYMQDKEDGDD